LTIIVLLSVLVSIASVAGLAVGAMTFVAEQFVHPEIAYTVMVSAGLLLITTALAGALTQAIHKE
jgi:ABC-type enterobactin transport system permease subunit